MEHEAGEVSETTDKTDLEDGHATDETDLEERHA